MSKLNRQQVFDKIATHLLTQNRKAQNIDAGCRYRDGLGLKCAVGCLIPDDKYDSAMEGSVVTGNPRVLAVLADVVGADVLAINLPYSNSWLQGLQSIHDSSEPRHWRQNLADFARNQDLDAAVLKAFEVTA